MEFLQETWNAVWTALQNFVTGAGWTIVTALSTAVIGIIVIRLILHFLRKVLVKSTMDGTLTNFIMTAARFILWMLLLFILASIAGIPLTPLVTALGAIALAVGLAVKDSLANLANGVMLIGTKPFKEGEYVDIDGVSGTVKSVNLLTTELITPDNKKIILPNSKITAASVTNYSAKPTRRVDFDIGVSYESDFDRVRAVILDEFSKNDKILELPEPYVKLSKFGESAIQITARAWVNNADYWDLYWGLNEALFKRFKAEKIEISYPQLDVHIKGGKQAKEDEES